jgi:uncharacterized protein (TIGR02271 family)
MNQNIVSAVFDSHSEAETAVRELRQSGVRDSALSVIARNDSGGGDYGDATTHEAKEKGEGLLKGALAGGGIGALLGIAALAIPGVGPLAAAGAIAASAVPEAAAIGAGAGALAGGLSGLLKKHGVSDEDAGYYEGRINDGGVFVSVDTSDGAITPQAAQEILNRAGGHSSSSPRTAPAAALSGSASGGSQMSASSSGASSGSHTSASTTSHGQAVQEERIPIVEEELRVGKREVERGGARVHTHVEETPVSEQVHLREEHVSVERRPVNQQISGDDLNRGDLLQDREIEMTERSEEAVVAKEARVREEVVVRKTAEERTENVQDTVRHTEVDVDQGRSGGNERQAFGFSGDGGSMSPESEAHSRDGATQSGR